MRKYVSTQLLQAVSLGLTTLFTISAFQLFGATTYGTYSALLAYGGLTFILDGVYFVQGFQIDYRKAKNKDLLKSTFTLMIVFSVVLFFLVFGVIRLSNDMSVPLVILFAAAYCLLPLKNFMSAYLMITEKLKVDLVVEVISKITSLTSLLVMVKILDIENRILVLLISYGLEIYLDQTVCISYFLYKERGGCLAITHWRSLFKYAWPLFLSNLMTGYVFRMADLLLINGLSGENWGKVSLIKNFYDRVKAPFSVLFGQRYPIIIDSLNVRGLSSTLKIETKFFLKFTAVIVVLAIVPIWKLDWILSIPFLSRLSMIREYILPLLIFTLIRGYVGLTGTIVVAQRRNKLEAIATFLGGLFQLAVIWTALRWFGLQGAFLAIFINPLVTSTALTIGTFIRPRKVEGTL